MSLVPAAMVAGRVDAYRRLVWHLPLGDIRVIDLTIARAGPTCVRQLADWGADVIRVEPPPSQDAADDTRHGCDFQNLHRNKRSLTLDLKTPDGQDVLMRLVDTADVLIENMRPPVKDRLGFSFDKVHAGTRGWSTARSPGSARTARTRPAAAWTRSPRAWAG